MPDDYPRHSQERGAWDADDAAADSARRLERVARDANDLQAPFGQEPPQHRGRRIRRRSPWPSVWKYLAVCGAVAVCAVCARDYYTARDQAEAAASTAQSQAHARVLTAQSEADAAVLETYAEALKAGGSSGGCGWILAQNMMRTADAAPERWALDLCSTAISGRILQQ